MNKKQRSSWRGVIGPGILVAATGVGAGDLLTASMAGSKVGLTRSRTRAVLSETSAKQQALSMFLAHMRVDQGGLVSLGTRTGVAARWVWRWWASAALAASRG